MTRHTTKAKKSAAGKSPNNRLNIIILAAGVAKKMKTFGPKALVPIGDKDCLLTRQINLLREFYTDCDITVVIGFEAQKVLDVIPNGVMIVENEKFDETNTVRSVALGLRVCLHPHVLVLHGDLLFDMEALKGVTDKKSSLLVSTKGVIPEEGVGINYDEESVNCLSYGLPKKWGQMAYFAGEELRLFKEYVANKSKQKQYIFEAINYVIDSGGHFSPVTNNGYVVEINSPKDMQEMHKRL